MFFSFQEARTQLHGARSFAVTCPEPWRCLLSLLSDDSIVLCSAAMVRYARHEMGKFGPDAFARLNTRLYTDEQPFPSCRVLVSLGGSAALFCRRAQQAKRDDRWQSDRCGRHSELAVGLAGRGHAGAHRIAHDLMLCTLRSVEGKEQAAKRGQA